MGDGAAQPLVRPPTLHLGRVGSASRLELFFDLAYVLVVLELAHSLYTDLTWHGLLVMVGLFTAIWISWMGFTLYANRFDTDDLVFRLAKLAATGAIAGCAASASDAVGKYAVPFAACYLLGRLILLGLYGRAWRHVPDARPTINVYLVCLAASSVMWAASLATPAPGRYWLWAAAVLVDAGRPLTIVNLALAAGMFAITGAYFARLHGRLAASWDIRLHRRLVAANWVRTAGWTAQLAVAVALV